MTYNGNLSGFTPDQLSPWRSSSPPPPPPPPARQSGAEVVSQAIAAAKEEITARREPPPPNPTVARVLEGLDALRTASKGAFDYTVEERTPYRLTLTATFADKAHKIRVRGGTAILGRGLLSCHMMDDMLLTDLAQRLVKKGLIPQP